MDFQEVLDELKAKIEGSMPSEYVAIMHRATADLEASGISEGVLKEGDKAPSFQLPNGDGKEISSATLLKEGPLAITFYRGIWCPYCNKDLSNLNHYTSQMKELGASMVGISPQSIQHNKKTGNQQKLTFDVLSDAGNEVAAQFGLRWTMVDPLKSLYRDNFRIQLPDYNGDDSWTLPIPARFVIDRDGTVLYAEHSVDYTRRPNPDALIDALKR